MNHVYRLVWSQSQNAFIVASEISSGQGKSPGRRTAVAGAVATALLGLGSTQAFAQDACVGGGTTSISSPVSGPCILGDGESVHITDAGGISSSNQAVDITASGTGAGFVSNAGSISGGSYYGIYASQATLSGGLTNSGSISSPFNGIFAERQSTLSGGLTNSGNISAGNGVGIYIGSQSVLSGGLTNSGSISSGTTAGFRLVRSTFSGGLINSGSIISSNLWGINYTLSTLSGGFTNSGTISGDDYGIRHWKSPLSGGFTNSGSIIGSTQHGVYLKKTSVAISGGLTNSGNIIGGQTGVYLESHVTISGGLINSGTISGGTTGKAISIDATSSLDSIQISGNDTAKFIGDVFAPNTPVTVDSAAIYTLDDGNHFQVSGFDNAGTLQIFEGDTGSITGNFTNSGTFTTEVTDTGYGQLTVTGTASLAGDLFINAASVTNGHSYSSGTVSGVITAGTLTGTFSDYSDNSALFRFTPDYDETNDLLNLVLTQERTVLESVQNEGNTPGEGAAEVLDGIIDGTITDLDPDEWEDVLDALANLETEEEVSDAVSGLLPLMTAGQLEALRASLEGLGRVLDARLGGGASSGDAMQSDRVLWAMPYGSWATQDRRNAADGYDADSYGLVMGAESDSGLHQVGVALGMGRSSIESQSSVAPNSADVDSYFFALYGSHDLEGNNEFLWQGDVGFHNTTGTRDVGLMGTTARSEYDSLSVHVGAELAHHVMISDKTTFTPSIRADYTWIEESAYTETGAGVLNLKVDERSADALIIGVDGELETQLTESTRLGVTLGVGYDALADKASITSAYAGASSATFITYGIDPDPWIGTAGIELTNTSESGVEFSLHYDAEARSDFINQSASAKVKWRY